MTEEANNGYRLVAALFRWLLFRLRFMSGISKLSMYDPAYISVGAYRYRFSSAEQRKKTGQWWQREALGPFAPLPWVERSGRPTAR